MPKTTLTVFLYTLVWFWLNCHKVNSAGRFGPPLIYVSCVCTYCWLRDLEMEMSTAHVSHRAVR